MDVAGLRRAAAAVSALALAVAWSAGPAPAARPADGALPASAERAYRVMAATVDGAAALDVVAFMDGRWRLAGNPAYDASLDHIRGRLIAAGFRPEPGAAAGVAVESFPTATPGWDYRVGTVAFADAPEPLLSAGGERFSLAINSFSTPAGGLTAPLVDIGRGTPADYAGRAVRGAVVLTDAPLGRVWRDAVKTWGAAGVISTSAAPYIRPASRPLSEEQQDVLQWDAIPYDREARSFGFKAPWRAAGRMRRRLAAGPVAVRVEIESAFYAAPARTLVAEIRGRSRPGERIVIAAHLQEPGANDNASGCGTLLAMARALQAAIAAGTLPPPERTLTFLWLDEMRGSREWLRAHPEAARGVQYMFSLDMTGENTALTGGVFRIERQADPSAVWSRPWDPHSEWSGAGPGLSPEALRGSLLNDLYLALCRRRAADVPWTVTSHPFEGGSDHEVFAGAGVPSVLAWHFTDRYYHTNLDRIDKTSAAEMQHVGIATGAAAWFLASASRADARETIGLLAGAASGRLALERREGAALAARGTDAAAGEAIERQVMAAWIKWYGEALDSVLRLPPDGPDAALRASVRAARLRLR